MVDPFLRPRLLGSAELVRTVGDWRALPARPLYRKLADALAAAIADGRIALGIRLPSERALAEQLGVSRRTVGSAYALLGRNGHLEARRGAGHYTRRRRGTSLAPFPVGSVGDADALDLGFAAPMDAPSELATAIRDLDPAALLHWHGYAPLGLLTLRQAIADRYTQRGAPTTMEQILVTNGAQHAIRLVVQAYVGLGDRVMVESPTYPLALDALRAHRAALFSTRVDPRDGWDLDAVECLLAAERPALAVVIPDCHMPTGRTMSRTDRERLVALVRTYDTTLLVDETTAELRDGEPLPPISAFGDRGVVAVGSLSKTAWGGLRIGWVRAEPAVVQRLAQIRTAFDVAGPPIEQLIAGSLLARLPEIAARRRRLAAAAREIAEQALQELLPEWRWQPPDGGLCLWLRTSRAGTTALAREAAAHGLRLLAGTRFAADRDLDHYLRLPVVLPPADLRRAIERLAGLDSAVEPEADTLVPPSI